MNIQQLQEENQDLRRNLEFWTILQQEVDQETLKEKTLD